MGNWNSYQITQLDHVVQPTDSVQALSYSPLTLSKHLWSIGLTPSMLLATVSGSASGVKRDNDISISWTPAHTAADTPLAGSNLPTRRAGWNQLYRTPLSNWPTRRAGWTYPYQFPSVTRPYIPLSHRPLRRAGQHRLPHFGELDAALSALRNTPNIGRIFGSLNKRPVSAFTRPPS